MQSSLSYRHRVITDDDLVFIRQLIAKHPGSSRRDLSMRKQAPEYLRNHPGIVRAMVASPHDKACITRFFGEMAALILRKTDVSSDRQR